MSRRLLMLLAVALAGLTLVAAGCGGDGQESAAPQETTTTETTTTEETTTEETTTEETTGASDFATAKNCQEFAQIGAKLSEAFTGTGAQDLQQTKEYFDQIVAAAPEEIKGDFQTIADAWNKIADALKGVDMTSTSPDPEALAKLTQLGQELDQAKLQQASQNISAWAQENCGGITTP